MRPTHLPTRRSAGHFLGQTLATVASVALLATAGLAAAAGTTAPQASKPIG